MVDFPTDVAATDATFLLGCNGTDPAKVAIAANILSLLGAANYAAATALLFSVTMTFSDAVNIVLNGTTGTKIGTATTQKLAFWNATPIVQPANTVDYVESLVNLGLRASGGTASATFPGALSCAALTATSIAGTGNIAATGHITMTDAKNIVIDTTTGTKIGTGVTQKIGFWNVTPVVQPAGATQAAPAAYVTGAFGLDSDVNMQALFDLVVAMRTALLAVGIIKGAA